MSGISAKRVVLYRFDRQPTEGFVTDTRFELAPGSIQMMSLEGNLQAVPYADVKALCFVSEGGSASLFAEHTAFERRPKIAGLWVRFALRDGDLLDGVLPHNLAEWPQAGYLATPPRSGSARQRVFLPRAALAGTELCGIIGKPPHRKSTDHSTHPEQTAGDQLRMFD